MYQLEIMYIDQITGDIIWQPVVGHLVGGDIMELYNKLVKESTGDVYRVMKGNEEVKPARPQKMARAKRRAAYETRAAYLELHPSASYDDPLTEDQIQAKEKFALSWLQRVRNHPWLPF